MLIGVPKEIKVHEYRVGMTPAAVREAITHGHKVLVQKSAGIGSGFVDADYQAVGAQIIDGAPEIFSRAEMIVKVKEPQPGECKMLREGQILFTYLHLAADPAQAKGLCDSGCTAVAYETVIDRQGKLPLLAPMSEVAGRMAIQVGAAALESPHGGRGVLVSGVPGVAPAKVAILGGGVVGTNAAKVASGMGAEVTILDRSIERLRYLDDIFGSRVVTRYATVDAVEEAAKQADMIVGAVLIPGATAPKLITKKQLSLLKPGSVLVDVAIDQGGCFETSHATTHADPTYVVDGIIHYCVANMPGAVARTSTMALGNATLPYTIMLANKGAKALADSPDLAAGLNIDKGRIVHPAVAASLKAAA